MSSRDSDHWRHLPKLRRNLNECTDGKTTFSRPESVYGNNVMLFFTNDCDLKRKNSRTAAPFGTQRDLSVMVSRLDAPGQRSIEKNLTQSNFSGGNHSCQWLPSRKKKEIFDYCRSRERGTSWSRKPRLSSLRPRIVFFFLKGLVSCAIKCS